MADPVPYLVSDRTAEFDRMRRELERGGGGGTSGGMTDDWKTSVDRQLQQLHSDVRTLWKSGLAATFVLAGMIAGLYLYANAKFDAVQQQLLSVQVNAQRLEGKVDTLEVRLGGKLDVLLERKDVRQKR